MNGTKLFLPHPSCVVDERELIQKLSPLPSRKLCMVARTGYPVFFSTIQQNTLLPRKYNSATWGILVQSYVIVKPIARFQLWFEVSGCQITDAGCTETKKAQYFPLLYIKSCCTVKNIAALTKRQMHLI